MIIFKMNQKNITEMTVDDYIREQKNKGKKFIRWGKSVKIFRNFAKAVFAPDEYGIGWKLPRSFPNGDMFMGIKHYKK